MPEDQYNPLQGIFALLGKKIDADAAARQHQASFDSNDPRYGVDEYGRVYLRGQASGAISSDALRSPGLMIGAGLLAVLLVVYLVKN